MRRTERLFAIIQRLRGRHRPLTGAELAAELEVSLRTVYRDVAELTRQRVPIRGEAGTGYVLDAGYDLPPLMLTEDELEAAMLGASWVAQRGDPALARAARSLADKLRDVVPPALRRGAREMASRPARPLEPLADAIDLATVREAIRGARKMQIRYVGDDGRESERVVWPFFIAYLERVRVVAAHCELRGAFRHFRTDRIRGARVLEDRVPEPLRALRARYRREHPARGEEPVAIRVDRAARPRDNHRSSGETR